MSKAKLILTSNFSSDFSNRDRLNESISSDFSNRDRLNESISRDNLIEIFDQIVEYTTRARKDIDSGDEEILKVDILQIIKYSDQLKELINPIEFSNSSRSSKEENPEDL